MLGAIALAMVPDLDPVDKVGCFAAHYKNEAELGEALAEAFRTGLVKREDLFITTKASLTSFLILKIFYFNFWYSIRL